MSFFGKRLVHSTTLIVPGLHGSGATHWQSWLHTQLDDAVWVEQPHWDRPELEIWSGIVKHAIDRARGNVWLVAHSFGCLAAVAAAHARPERIAGALLVAPADPDRFSPDGTRHERAISPWFSVSAQLPDQPFNAASVLVASRNDPWMSFTKAQRWANNWGSQFVDLGNAGHINVESGFGPWPQGLDLLANLRRSYGDYPTGRIEFDTSH